VIRNRAIDNGNQAMPPTEVTALLAAWSEGDNSALEKLLPPELHRLAHRYMSRERKDHTLVNGVGRKPSYAENSAKPNHDDTTTLAGN